MSTQTMTPTRLPLGRVFTAGLAAVAAATVANLLVYFLLAGLAVLPAGFMPLQPGPIAAFTVTFTLIGVGVFALIDRLSANPRRTYTWIAAAGLLVSILPNLALMANPAAAPFPGGTAAAFGTLILFHFVAFAAYLLTLFRIAYR